MCGIAGYVNFDTHLAEARYVQAMIDVIAHRGPDDEGIYTDGGVGLGHRRLSILDLSELGRQPMGDPQGSIWITFNGEIYNFHEIRRELETRGYVFRSASDTEVVIQAYREWGTDCLKRFNGMFAFALWDAEKRQLWLARDRIGIKPLFYAHLDKCLLFGSEIKALLAHPAFGDRSLDYEALAYYLATNYMPVPYTLFKRARQVLPGHYLLISPDGRVEDVAYWDVVYQEGPYRDDRAYLDEFTSLLEDAVRSHLVSDVPFGAFLSGGLDSSAIAYVMSRCLAEPVKTFTIGFDENSYSEAGYARQVAERIGAAHHERIVTAEDAELVRRLVWHAEEPTADSSMLAVYRVAELARQHVKMAQSGDGADEILAGYPTYTASYLHRWYRLMPGAIRNAIPALVEHLPRSDGKVSFDAKLRRFTHGARMESSEDAHALWRIICDSDLRAALLKPIWDQPGARADIVNLYRAWFACANAEHPLNRMLYVDTRLYLPSDMLVKVDRMTMAHGLEARVPFLDYRLVEFMATVPPHLKLHGYRHGKYLLKQAMKGCLPDSVLKRKKAGFNVPKSSWMKGNLKSFVMEALSPARIRRMELFDVASAQRLLEDHFARKADNSHPIWGLLTLSLWWDHFVEGIQP